MKIRLFSPLVLTIAMHAALAQESWPAPQPAVALGMLTGFVYTAEAIREVCPKHLEAARVEAVLEPWFTRNARFAEELFAYGRSAKWSLAASADPQHWLDMQQRERARSTQWVKSYVEADPKAFCMDLLLLYKNGTNEIGNFPTHLGVLGIRTTGK